MKNEIKMKMDSNASVRNWPLIPTYKLIPLLLVGSFYDEDDSIWWDFYTDESEDGVLFWRSGFRARLGGLCNAEVYGVIEGVKMGFTIQGYSWMGAHLEFVTPGELEKTLTKLCAIESFTLEGVTKAWVPA
jgi:hypothetical protein